MEFQEKKYKITLGENYFSDVLHQITSTLPKPAMHRSINHLKADLVEALNRTGI